MLAILIKAFSCVSSSFIFLINPLRAVGGISSFRSIAARIKAPTGNSSCKAIAVIR